MVKSVYFLLLLFVFSNCSSSGEEKPVVTPFIKIQDISTSEGNNGTKSIDFTLTLQEISSVGLTLQYTTEDASAFQYLDYKKQAGQIIIPAGKKTATISLDIISDEIKEGDEVFRLIFESTQDIDFNQTSAEITIKNDDTQLPYQKDDYITPDSYQGWKLVWKDEFNEKKIDNQNWTHEIGNGDNGWGNSELEYYTDAPENSRLENGNLIIEARKESLNGFNYTSARMVSKDKQSFKYGRIDIRAKLPFGKGIWPALWMLGDNINQVGWPACGEIDIMELIGNHPEKSHATVHFGKDFANHKYVGGDYSLSNEIFNNRFHVFSVVREENQMWFYIDDILFFDFNSNDTQGASYPFNQKFFFILNVAVGGQWPGSPDSSTQFPQQMLVDYIRVFEKE